MVRPNHQMQMILDAYRDMGALPIETLSPEAARQMPLLDRAALYVYGHHFMKKAIAPMPLNVGKVEHRQILVPGNDRLLVRIYTPRSEKPPQGWPVLVYYHGGGWVLATLDTYDASCRALCDATDAVVISVQYRQAPEHKFPAAPEDAFGAYLWAGKAASQLDIDPERIAVGGESAGGNLAAVVCLMARAHGEKLPLHQLLIYPVTDIAGGAERESGLEYINAAPLSTALLSWMYSHYVPAGVDRTQPYLSPINANLEGMPPATVILADIDPLRSEGSAYARQLNKAGVLVNMKIFEGVTHEFFGLAGLVNEAGAAVLMAARDLRQAYGNEQNVVERLLDKVGV